MLTQAERMRLAQLHKVHRKGGMHLFTSNYKEFDVVFSLMLEECTDEMLEQWRIELGDRTMNKLQRIADNVIEYQALKAKAKAA